jgi:hypothetical protein
LVITASLPSCMSEPTGFFWKYQRQRLSQS